MDGKYSGKSASIDKDTAGSLESTTVGERIMFNSHFFRLVAPSSTADQPVNNGANVANAADLAEQYMVQLPQNYVRYAIIAPLLEAAKELNVTLPKDEKALLSQLNAIEKRVSETLREYLQHKVTNH